MAKDKELKNKEGAKKHDVPKKASSPPRKTVPNRESSQYAGKIMNSNQVKFKYVGIDNVAIALVYKPDGQGPAFLGNILSHIEGNATRMEKCKLLFFTKLRKSDGSDQVEEVPNKQGNMYPFETAVFCTLDGEPMTAAVNNYTKTLNEIAKVECATEWKYGVPLFSYKGNSTPPNTPPLSTYLLNADCALVMKRVFQDCDTKTELMNNEFRNDILSAVFGDANVGFEIIEGFDEEFYDSL